VKTATKETVRFVCRVAFAYLLGWGWVAFYGVPDPGDTHILRLLIGAACVRLFAVAFGAADLPGFFARKKPVEDRVWEAAGVIWDAYVDLRGKDWKDCTEAERDIKIIDTAGLRQLAKGKG
jgi:hypothetical protein